MAWLLRPIDAFLDGLPPWAWRLSVCLFLVVGSLWVLLIPRKSIYDGAPTQERWRDLRIWVALLTLPYLLIYLWL